MKEGFLFFVLVALPLIVVGAGFYFLVWQTFRVMYDDWKLGKELEEIRAESAARRRQRETQRPDMADAVEPAHSPQTPSTQGGSPTDSGTDARFDVDTT